jgi:hypothetical protein
MRIIVTASLCAAMLAAPALLHADEPRTQPSVPAAGLRAYRDPTSGVLLPKPPAAAQHAFVPDAAVSSSAAGLVEQPAPGGGVMVDLQGRFHSHMSATVAADGSVSTSCRTDGASAAR